MCDEENQTHKSQERALNGLQEHRELNSRLLYNPTGEEEEQGVHISVWEKTSNKTDIMKSYFEGDFEEGSEDDVYMEETSEEIIAKDTTDDMIDEQKVTEELLITEEETAEVTFEGQTN